MLAGGSWVLSASRAYGLTLQGDGNLVAYGPRDRVLWSSGTYGNPGARLRVQDDGNVVLHRSDGSPAWYTGWDRTGLRSGDSLVPGQQVTSPSGRYSLVLQRDGNAVVHGPGARPLFFTGSYGADRLALQGDGNLVAYRGGRALWSSGTWREGRSRLEVQDDGNVVLYRGDGSPAWYTGWDTGTRTGAPGSGTPVAVTPVAPPTPAPAPPTEVYYATCAEARAAGAAPISRGEPGYRAGLDGDGDGVACE